MEEVLNSPIMYATQYWGAPAFIKISPAENGYDLQINDQHMAMLTYGDNLVLQDVEGRFDDEQMINEITMRIEAKVH
ncbi:MAG: hypothetical protein EOP47_21540 [Sphingobacteriaceae bacterium]|nr:MAG: hypothetical protein EOP47_21540 [Sphingobacteriaceae bacterium]